ncbi:MAG: MmgE/PrpD family protein [Deltaproteobacteria bacterium]|nr:MmgE/PrpD family protein [Deltaproteobacteria bacterium]MDZ4341382.1 MmgE/PrpD family protein [Candidatus Binatia bacterium]
MGATEKISRFIVDTDYEDIPRDAVEKAKRTALDCLAAALAGVVEPVSQTITGYIRKLGGPTQATVFGAGLKVSVPDAALANGSIAHALDYDDCGVKIGHPSVLVLPAVLSLGEHLGASGQDILTAYILGLEVEGKLALHADFKLMQARLNHQTWYGSVGAVAACAKLLRLDVAKTRMALGIAANFACGLAANHGSMAAAAGAGNACRNGVVAALMAQEGFTANPDIIEAKNGFYDTLVGRDHYDAERMAESLGNPFYVESPGIGLKKYPSCYHTHRALDGVLQLMGEHRLTDKDIAEVDVGTSERALRVLAFSEPETPYQAKYSMPHCIAAAVVDHQVTLDTFTSYKLEDRGIVEARKKVHLSFPDIPIWPGLADVGPDTKFVGNPVTIRTTDGRSFSARVDIPRGDPALPLTDDELLAKYRECARSQLRPDDIERSLGMVLGLERVADIGTLMAILRPPSLHKA